MKKVAGVNAAMCHLGPLLTLKDPLPQASGSNVHRTQFFKKGYLVQIEDLLPESACIQCLIDVDTMPGPSPNSAQPSRSSQILSCPMGQLMLCQNCLLAQFLLLHSLASEFFSSTDVMLRNNLE